MAHAKAAAQAARAFNILRGQLEQERMLTFDELWKRLNDGDESVAIEAKTAQQLGSSIQETICAFANEPDRGGGYLLLGARLAQNMLFPSYEVVGVPDPDKIQADLATLCRSVFNVVIRPQTEVHIPPHGKAVVVAFIPEAQSHEKPVYINSRGLPKGALRRIGSTDQVCTDDDLQVFYQRRGHATYDETVVEGAMLSDLDSDVIEEYRRARREANPAAPELKYTDADMLYSLCCATSREGSVRPTIAGLLLFGKKIAIRRWFPMMRVDYIRVPGREWVKDPDARFESVEMLDPILLAIPRAINAVLDDIPKAFRLPANANQRVDVPLIPRTALREAVVNAVMHRSYRQKSPIQIIRYSNRLEIRNPGHSLVPDERLGEPGSVTRNEKLAAVLHETRYAETKGSGIRAMREALERENLTPPTFESDREKDTFVVTFLFHHFLNAEDIRWLGRFNDLDLTEDEQRALVFVREMGAINNAAYRDINHMETLVASGHLRRLRDAGLLEQKGKGSKTYYIPKPRLLMQPAEGVLPANGDVKPSSTAPPGLTPQVTPQPTGFRGNLQGLPTGLAQTVRDLGQRATPAEVRAAIRRLCSWRPLSSERLAEILGRNQHYVISTHLRPMIRDGELEYTHPDRPAHPQQAYHATGLPPQEPSAGEA